MAIYQRYRADILGRSRWHQRIGAEAANRDGLNYRSKLTLERLRYHAYHPASLAQRTMQRLGDVGRALCGFLDPRQTGGGWW